MRSQSEIIAQISKTNPYRVHGRVSESTSLLIKAVLPGVHVGEICNLTLPANNGTLIKAEVIGFKEGQVFLMPLSDITNLGPDSEVIPTGKPFTIKCGYELLGRVLNGIGEPIDGQMDLSKAKELVDWPVERACPDPYTRQPVDRPISMGLRAVDGLLTVGRGQRIGLFAGSGVGKSSLMGQIARNTHADIVVVCLVGERGREVMEFIDHSLGAEGLKRSVVVVATSDAPSLVRAKSCYVATSIAEWFRDQGHNVLFMMDSVTRFARAQREIGLALSEPPARQGYPPSVFAHIPRLLERTGNNHLGSITALYTVLVQAGDMEEPIADEVRGILDGHIVLSRELSARNHWPAIDVLHSLSRVMPQVVDDEHMKASQRFRESLAIYEKSRDLITLGAYSSGSDPKLDYAINKMPNIELFLKQGMNEREDLPSTKQKLVEMF